VRYPLSALTTQRQPAKRRTVCQHPASWREFSIEFSRLNRARTIRFIALNMHFGVSLRSSYDLILLVQSLVGRSCRHEGMSAAGRSPVMMRSVL